LVYCSVTGYGCTGPFANNPSLDGIIAAESGITFCTGEPDGPPIRPQPTITDNTAGFYAFKAVLAALLSREMTGKGAFADVAAFDTQLCSLGSISAAWLNGKQDYIRVGTSHPTMVPYQMFSTKDGFITIGTGNDNQFVKVCEAMGIPEVGTDPSFVTNNLRVANRRTLVPLLSSILARHPTAFWLKKFAGKGFPTGGINNMEQTFAHPQAQSRSLVVKKNHPTVGSVAMVASPVVYNARRLQIRYAAPTLGEHNSQIYGEILGRSAEELEVLPGVSRI